MELWFSVLLLLGNAFFVGAEFAVMAARRSQIEPAAAAGNSRAQLVLEAFDNTGSMLASSQLGITVCSVLLGAVAEDAIHHRLEGPLHQVGVPDEAAAVIALILALLVVAYLHVVVGEMIPKNLAIAGPDRAAMVLAPPLLWFTKAIRPLISLLEAIARWLVRRFGVEPQNEVNSVLSAEEVSLVVAESEREGLLASTQQDRVRGALEFSDRVAADVEVPLPQVVTLPIGATPADLERQVAKHGFSRFPVVDESGEPVGYLHLKDVLYAEEELYEQPVPPKRIRPLATVQPGDEVEDVLVTMQRSGAHLARVVTTEGRVSGIVYLEDLLEELVGQVRDESQNATGREGR